MMDFKYDRMAKSQNYNQKSLKKNKNKNNM